VTAGSHGVPGLLAGLPPELLDAPISALLADAPAEDLMRPQKRQRTVPGELHVPPARTAEIRRLLECPPPEETRILTWNVDGLDEVGGPEGTMLRALAVALVVAKQRPVAVLLQEAIPPVLELLSAPQCLGKAYEVVVPENPQQPYYVAILLDRQRLKRLGRPLTVPFPTSQMGRQILAVTAEVCSTTGPPILLATAHLESTKDHAPERKRQLAQCLRFLQDMLGADVEAASSRRVVGTTILGGDLNLRDEEVKAVLRELSAESIPMLDAWEFLGSPPHARWTWDTSENQNLGVTFASKTRFDRLLFLSQGFEASSACGRGKAKAKAKGKAKAVARAGDKAVQCLLPVSRGSLASSETGVAAAWRPTSIALVGREKVPGLGRFPSDHWGLLTTWAPGEGPSSHLQLKEPSPQRPPAPSQQAFHSLSSTEAVISLDD